MCQNFLPFYNFYLFITFGGAEPSLLGWGYSLAVVCRLLILAASLAAEHGLQCVWASALAAHGLQQLQLKGSRAQVQQLWHTG